MVEQLGNERGLAQAIGDDHGHDVLLQLFPKIALRADHLSRFTRIVHKIKVALL